MRILHIVTAFPRFPNDIISPWLVEMLKRLRAAGYDVEVLAPAYRGGGNREFGGIPVHRFRYFPARWEDLTHDQATLDRLGRSLRYKIMPLFYVLGGVWAAWRLCRRRRYDVVHVHWPLPHALFGWAARRACGACMVTSWYGVELRWVKSSLPWLKRFLVWALRASDQVVAISSATAREITNLVPVSVRVIPYTVGFPEAAPGASSPPADDTFVILFVGSLVERKGVRYLIDAVPPLPAHLPANVDARGDTEGLGVVLLEAMSYGVPVIGSDLGGITDIVIDGETGLLVPPQDSAALAAALERLATDRGLARRLGEAGGSHVRRHFSWPAIIAQWEECYAAVLDSGGGSS